MANNFRIKVFTPAGLVLSEETDSVKLPSSNGEIGVLPQHTKYAGLLGSGTLEFSTEIGVKKINISGGLTQFANNTLTVLADSVDLNQKISPESAS